MNYIARNWHLWVLSFNNPTEFLVRLVQYSAIEIVGISFGHLAKYSLGVGISGIRSQTIKELRSQIAYNSPRVQKALALEKNTIALLGYAVVKGKQKAFALLHQ